MHGQHRYPSAIDTFDGENNAFALLPSRDHIQHGEKNLDKGVTKMFNAFLPSSAKS
jgi:hypothetical protein